MNRTEKAALVETLNKTFTDSTLVVVTHQVGLTVDEVNDLRGKMRSAGARYKVTKNRIARLALKGTEYENLDASFTGPTAIATSEDPVAAAKVAVEFANANEKPLSPGLSAQKCSMSSRSRLSPSCRPSTHCVQSCWACCRPRRPRSLVYCRHLPVKWPG